MQQPLPLGPLIPLQFAICYINLAIPSTAARVAINVRFLQRFGVRPTAAVSAGVIDSLAGFAVQIVLLVSLFFFADLDFELDLDPDQLSGLLTIAMIVIAAIVILALIALARAGGPPAGAGRCFVRPARRCRCCAHRPSWCS